ncbi:MAG: PaaI family thioesterase [Candidatus Dormibacteria bacterium]
MSVPTGPLAGSDATEMNRWSPGTFPGLLGIVIEEASPARVVACLPVRPDHLAPNGYLHAGAVVTLADTAAGYGTVASLPDGRVGFTTIELKANFLGTTRDGTIRAQAQRLHGGRTTQVWDVTVASDSGRTIAVFRCTQLLLSASG